MAQGFSVNVYGTVNQQPPYRGTVDGNLPAVDATYESASIAALSNFPTTNINIWPIQPGVKMAGGVYCYGVIEVPPSGLNQYSEKYVVKETVATLATLRG